MRAFIPEATDTILRDQLTQLCQIANEDTTYDFAPQAETRQFLREEAREFFGYSRDDHNASIRRPMGNSGMSRLATTPEVAGKQQQVQLYYYGKHCSKEDALFIQECKAGIKVLPRHINEKKLESQASYAIVRGEVEQVYDMSLPRETCRLETPRQRRLYYLNMPKLQNSQTSDFHHYCDPGAPGQGGSLKRGTRMRKLKHKFKTILAMGIKVAADNSEGFDIVTPNAFFFGLTSREQDRAKELFTQAAIETAQEINPDELKNFKGFFIHTSDSHQQLFEAAAQLFKIPVILNNKDASAPQRIAMQEYGWGVAESLMGEALGAVGNGGMGRHANHAKEENDFRVIPELVAVFAPHMNKRLLDSRTYQHVNVDQVLLKGPSRRGTSRYSRPSQQLLDNLKLNPNKIDHLRFWSTKVKGGGKSFSINLSTPSMKVPHTIFNILTLIKIAENKTDNRELSSDDLKRIVNKGRTQWSWSPSSIFRKTTHRSIEVTHLRDRKQGIDSLQFIFPV